MATESSVSKHLKSDETGRKLADCKDECGILIFSTSVSHAAPSNTNDSKRESDVLHVHVPVNKVSKQAV